MPKERNTEGIETFRKTSNTANILKDADFMKQFKDKTEFFNKGAEYLYQSHKSIQPMPAPKPLVKGRFAKIV